MKDEKNGSIGFILHPSAFILKPDGDTIVSVTHLIPFYIEHPSSLLATFLGFVLAVLLLVRFVFPAARTTLGERESRIEESHLQVERALADTKQLRDDYAARLQRIEEEARQRIDQAVREAEAARTEIIAEARQSAEALRRRSEEEIARERMRSRILLRRQIVQITLDAAEQAVRANSGDAVQRQLIGDFITLAGAHNRSDKIAGNGSAVVASAAPITQTSGGA